ncbi:VP2 [Gokushovirinae sp.]|nr:VP2 [Gokushovirinae sp.]
MAFSASGNFQMLYPTNTTPVTTAMNGAAAAIDRIAGITQANSAASAAQADQLRKWQEQQNQKAMEFNAAEAAKNRNWQQYMSNTAHQREVADLKAAGLNPVLSAMGGNGAAVTSGATASGVTSSGAKGDVDMSMSQAMVSLLGSLVNADNQMKMADLSAKTNLAVAEKYTAMSKIVAEINGFFNNRSAEIAGKYGLASSQTAAQASQANAALSAFASMMNTQRNIDSAKELQTMKQEQEKYMAQNYPQTYVGAVSSMQQGAYGFMDALKKMVAGDRDWKQPLYDLLGKGSVFKPGR